MTICNNIRRRMLRAAMAALALLQSSTLVLAQSCFAERTSRPVTGPNRNTVVITPESGVFTEKDFGLAKTLGNIIATSGSTAVDSPAERISLLTSMIRSFRAREHLSVSGVRMRVDLREGEAALDPIKMLDPKGPDGLVPVALFNRWDLVPDDFRYCGEHRIVYAKNSKESTDRFFLIFEAGVDNPDPQNDPKACLPIIAFWDNLKNLSGPKLAEALHQFYFTGLDTNNDGKPDIQPVIHHQHLGVPYGQVRGNLFRQPPNFLWQLREWRTSVTVDGAPVFTVDTVKKNPHPALYGPAQPGEEAGLNALRQEFTDEFLRVYTSQLSATEQRGVGAGNTIVADLGAKFENRTDSFQSNADDRDDPARISGPTNLTARIKARLDELKLPQNCQLAPEHILNRAGVISCGGCHKFSDNKPIGPGVTWPASSGFVHVDEKGGLSPALNDHFLDDRRRVLENALKTLPSAPAAPPAGRAPVLSARDALTRVQRAENRTEAIDALRDMEVRVQTLRAQDTTRPGAVTRFRRTH